MQTRHTNTEADEIARAEQSVAAHKAELTRSLRRVESSSKAMAQKLGDELKPAVAVAVMVAGAAGATALTIALVKRARRRSPWLAPPQPSTLSVAAKTAGLWALRLLARRVAQELVQRLQPAEGAPSTARRPSPAE